MATAAPPRQAADDARWLDVSTAALEIRQACDELGAQAHRSPFFLVVGAGASFPPVPLASHIVEHCQRVAAQYHREGGTQAAEAALDQYSHWFAAAYPGARQRQQYLRSLIEHKALSLPSLRLAHLLSVHKLTNMVVTTNFDDFIARALRLFGEEPVVCDHPRTVGRIDRERPDVQIVHVHGSYLFYDCANLRGEVNDRAQADDESSFTMVGLLDSLLWNRSPIVIGYSGWEGDVVMSALRRRLRGGNALPQSLYWCCYRRSEIQALPDWLRDNGDVRFVVPPPAPAATPPEAVPMRSGAEAASAERSEPTLPAVSVLDEINRVFEIGAPTLFVNPVEHLARSLESALPEASAPAGDPYAFKALIERLHTVARSYRQPVAVTPASVNLDLLRSALRASDYPTATRELAAIIPARLRDLGADDRREVTAAAGLVASSVGMEQGKVRGDEQTARVIVFDSQLDAMLGTLPPGTVWISASRTGQFGYETVVDGRAFGAFSFQFSETLASRSADLDHDGEVSLLEAVIAAAHRMARKGESPQSPAVAGAAETVALFSARSRAVKRPRYAKLLALLVGVSEYRQAAYNLRGPVNDVARLQALLERREGRLAAEAQILPLLDGAATNASVRRHLAGMCAAAGPQDIVLFFVSGHAARSEVATDRGPTLDLVLGLHDVDERTWEDGIRHREILDLLAGCTAAAKVVVLDF
jgi:hypothetical protein